MSDKQKLVYEIVIIALATVLVGELIYFGVRIYLNRKESTFYTVINSVIVDDENNYVGVGSSDYRYSKFNKYDEGYDKATIFKIKDGDNLVVIYSPKFKQLKIQKMNSNGNNNFEHENNTFVLETSEVNLCSRISTKRMPTRPKSATADTSAPPTSCAILLIRAITASF